MRLRLISLDGCSLVCSYTETLGVLEELLRVLPQN